MRPSNLRPPPERRREVRREGGALPVVSPAETTIVDCAPRGVGIETKVYLPVGGLTSVNLSLPTGKMELLGRVCWAKLVASRSCGDGDSEPIFRAGLSFVEGQSFEGWDRVRVRLASPSGERTEVRPKRKVIKWRPPRGA